MAANFLTWWWLWRHPGAEWRHYYLHPCRYLKFGKNSVLCKQCNVLKWKKPFAGFGFVLLTQQSKKKNSRSFDPAWLELTNPNMTLTWNCQTLVFAWFVRQTIVWISKTSINNYWREVALAKHHLMSEMKDICLRLVLRSKKTKKNTHAHVLYSAVITTALNNKTFALLVRVQCNIHLW